MQLENKHTIKKLLSRNGTRLTDLVEFLHLSEKELNRKKKLQRIFIGGIFALLIIAVFAFILSETNRQKSLRLQEEISRTAKANSIATKAYTMLEHDPTLAFRLAEASYNIVPTPLNKQVIMASYANVPFYLKLEGHDGGGCVRSIVSKDGKYILTWAANEIGKVWDFQGNLICELKGHSGASRPGMEYTNFSDNSKYVVTCSPDSTARLWNLQGECLAVMKHNGAVNSVCFSPSPFGEGRGGVILTASSDKTARLWDLKGNEIVKMEHEKGVAKSTFNDNNETIVTISGGTLYVWKNYKYPIVKFKKEGKFRDLTVNPFRKEFYVANSDTIFAFDTNYHIVRTYTQGDSKIYSIYSDAQGKYLSHASYNSLTHIWEIETGKTIKVSGKHTSNVWSAQFSPDGTKIATASDDATARLWDLEGNQLMALKGHTSQVFSAQFSPDGKQLVTASGDKTARIWTIEPTENPILKGHTGYVVDANFSPDGSKIVTAGWDYTARLWEKSGKLKHILKGHNDYWILNAQFLKNDNVISATDEIILWNLKGDSIRSFYKHTSAVTKLGFNNDGKFIITSSLDNYSILLSNNLDSIQKIENVTRSEFIKQNDIILSFSTDSTLYFYRQQPETDSIHYSKFIQLKIPITSFTAAEFSQNGKWLITASEDSTLRVWNMSFLLGTLNPNQEITVFGKEKALQEMKVNAMLSSILFSPTEEKFVSVSNDNIIRLWNLDGHVIAEMKGHSDGIQDVNFSHDGKNIASGSLDKTVKLWDLTGSELMTYTGYGNNINKAKFSLDNKYILSASDDMTARLMPVSVEMVLEKINKEKVRGEVWRLGEKEKEVYGVGK